jgi:hypothetical protein
VLHSPKFQEQQFIDAYNNVIGYNEEDYNKKEKYRHNFLYLITQPAPAVYQGFDKRIK